MPIDAVEAGVRFIASDEGVSDITAKMGTHFSRTTEKMQRTIQQAGYLSLALKRIATYTAIFTFFGALTKLIGEAISLQTRLAEVSTLVNLRNRDMAESFRVVTGDLLRLSPYLGDAISLTKGLYEIMSAGVTEPVDAFKLLIVSAKYAKAGITDLATAASSLTAIMKAYGYTADQMRAKSDMLFASVMEGKYHAEELNQAIGKVLPTAAAMGVQIDEISAALAVMTQRGLDVNEAATALNRMMLAFMRPIDKAKKEFQKLGWAWGRNAFEGIGLLGVLRRLVQASARYGDILPKIFRRQRALRGAFILAGEGFRDYVRLLQKIRDATEGGGEVARGYGKMIGTVAEEVKAAGAKMQVVMYDLWKGKGFEWLGGFIRLLSSLITVVLKASVVWTASIPIILKVISVYKRAMFTLGMWQANMTAFYATTGKMTKALYAQGQAFRIMTARAEKFAKALLLLKVSLVAAVVAYIAIKAGIDAWKASSDRGIDAIHQQTKATKALKDELNLYIAASKKAGEVAVEVQGKLEALARAGVLTALRAGMGRKGIFGRRRDQEEFHKIMKALNEEFGEASVKAGQMWLDVRKLQKELKEGTQIGGEYNYILQALAKNWGYTTKEIKGFIEAGRVSLSTMKAHIEGIRFLYRLQRDWNKILESSSKHVRNLAAELSKEELEDGIKLMEELMTLEEGTPKFLRAVEYFEALGLSLEDLTKKKLPEFLAKWREAAAKQPEVFREMEYEEMMRQLKVGFEKIYPPLQKLENMVLSLADTWETEWAAKLGASAEIMQLYVDENRAGLEIIKSNWERLGDVQGKVIVEDLIKMLDKGLTAQQKAARKALVIHKTLINDFIRVDANMEVMRNELRREEWDDIVEQTKKFIELEKIKLDKWVALELQAEKEMYAIWEEYTNKLLELEGLLAMARQVSNVRRIQELAKTTKKEIDMTSWSEFEKQARYQQTFRQYFELMAEMGITTKAELKAGLAIWKKTFGGIDKLSRIIFRQLTRNFGKFLASIILDLKDLNENFGSFLKEMLVVFGRMVAEMVLTWAKGLVTMKVAFKVFMTEVVVMMKFLMVAAAVWIVATCVKGVLGWLGILKDEVSEEMQAILDKLEEARKAGEEISSVISKVQLTAPSGGLPSTGKDKQVMRWVDEYAEALKRLQTVLEYLAKQTEFTRGHIDLIEETWGDLLDAVEKYGLEGSTAIIELIRKTRELGIEVKVLNEYTLKWLDKGTEGLNKMIWAAGNTKEEMQRLANLALATFNAMIVSGRSWAEALAVMEEPLLRLKLKMDALGVSGGEAIDALLDLVLVRRLFSDLFDAIEGNRLVLEALGNTASLFGEEGAKAFADVAAQAQQYYDKLLAAGLTEQQALAIMAPTLQKLQYYAEQYGLTLDANILKLIEEAEALGLLEGAGLSMTEILTTGFEGVIAAIRELIDVLIGGLSPALDDVGRKFNDLGDEGVLGASPRAGIPSGGFTPIDSPGSGDLVAIIQIDGQRFYKAVVPYFRKGVRYGEFEEGDY